MENYMTQTQKLAKLFKSGFTLTQEEAKRMLGCKNLRARVAELRDQGMCIYTNKTKRGTTYRLGTPNRDMVALAYTALGSKLFS
jgi:hypothetical protein